MMKRGFSTLIAALLVMATVGCAKAPPSLSPAGTAAFHATRIVRALDLFRDAAISANDQSPPLISTNTTRQIVLYHRSAVTTIGAAPSGWAPVVQTGLAELVKNLPAHERQQLAPYVVLVQTLIAEVTRDR